MLFIESQVASHKQYFIHIHLIFIQLLRTRTM